MIRPWLNSAEHPNALFEDGDEPGRVEIEVSIFAASGDLVSAALTYSSYFGGAHGLNKTEQRNWSIKLNRVLKIGDIFQNASDPNLRRLVSTHYNAASGKGHEGCSEPRVASEMPLLNEEGLRFVFDPYAMGAYTCGGESKISWAEARPYLRHALPFGPRVLRTPHRVLPIPRPQ